jgi:hypothetical protein
VSCGPASEISPHSRLAALLLCWPLGLFGVHRFYVGKVGTGLLQLITVGGFQLWTLVDFVLILSGVFADSNGRPLKRWTTQGADLRLLPIVAVAATTSALVAGWVAVLARATNPSLAEIIWPLVGVQAIGGIAIGFAVENHRFLHAVAASVVGSYFVWFVVIVVGLAVVRGTDVGQGVGLAAWVFAALFYVLTPVAGLLSLAAGAAADTSGPDAAA